MKRKNIFYWVAGIGAAAIAIAAAFYFDDALWHFIVQHQTATLGKFMRNVSRFGDWPSHLVLGFALLGIAWLRRNKKWMRIFLAMLVAMAMAGLAGQIIKRAFPRARPSVKTELRWGGPRFSTKYHSFPSGHMDASTAFFGVLILARRRVGLACIPVPVLIGASRIYIGAHYLSDVVCGGVLGMGCALLAAHFFLTPAEGAPLATEKPARRG